MSQHNKTCKGGKKNKKTKGGIHEIVIPAIFVGINNFFNKTKKNKSKKNKTKRKGKGRK
jgi:hypothetical protein